MRLIDADKLIEELNKNSIFRTVTNAEGKSAIEIIEEQQTSFDVDKVVKKLKHSQYMLLEEVKNATSYSHKEELIENIRHYEYAINIVKAGGIDET